tara:strand:- start:160 stop:363 length:204 start_codon:yes stop_codon:yes gene_type:complete
MLDLLIILFSAIAVLAIMDLVVFTGVFIACGFRVPTRKQYFDNAAAVFLGLLGGVGVYCLTVIAFCL